MKFEVWGMDQNNKVTKKIETFDTRTAAASYIFKNKTDPEHWRLGDKARQFVVKLKK
tara:strand:+ start:4584 stop:4754 length:171 start_codon:yes stop_codon:yes gene_type:complete